MSELLVNLPPIVARPKTTVVLLENFCSKVSSGSYWRLVETIQNFILRTSKLEISIQKFPVEATAARLPKAFQLPVHCRVSAEPQ